jgi:hypothetical protein
LGGLLSALIRPSLVPRLESRDLIEGESSEGHEAGEEAVDDEEEGDPRL